jgi:hypothetical protein
LERSKHLSVKIISGISSSGCIGKAHSCADNGIFTLFGKSQGSGLSRPMERDVVQLRMMADIVAFDLTHVYLALDVLNSEGGEGELSTAAPKKQAILRFTLPECHVFLRALREFHGLIEVTTPVLEEARRLQNRNGSPANGKHAAGNGEEASLDSILERLGAGNEECRPQAEI